MQLWSTRRWALSIVGRIIPEKPTDSWPVFTPLLVSETLKMAVGLFGWPAILVTSQCRKRSPVTYFNEIAWQTKTDYVLLTAAAWERPLIRWIWAYFFIVYHMDCDRSLISYPGTYPVACSCALRVVDTVSELFECNAYQTNSPVIFTWGFITFLCTRYKHRFTLVIKNPFPERP